MDICTVGELFKEWTEPVCAVATLILSIVVFFLNKKVDAESKRNRAREEELRQPSGISAWLEGLSIGSSVQNATINNATNSPIYNIVVSAVVTKGYGCDKGEMRQGVGDYREIFALVPPGRHSFSLSLVGFWGMSAYPVLEISFTCTDGKSWIRRGNGTLEQIDTDPFTHYGIERPCRFGILTD